MRGFSDVNSSIGGNSSSEYDYKQVMLNCFMVESLAKLQREAIYDRMKDIQFWKNSVHRYNNCKDLTSLTKIRGLSISIDALNESYNRFEFWKKEYRLTLKRLKSDRIIGKNVINLP